MVRLTVGRWPYRDRERHVNAKSDVYSCPILRPEHDRARGAWLVRGEWHVQAVLRLQGDGAGGQRRGGDLVGGT